MAGQRYPDQVRCVEQQRPSTHILSFFLAGLSSPCLKAGQVFLIAPRVFCLGHTRVKVFSGKENTQHQETLVLDSRLHGNDRVSSLFEIP